MRFAVLVFPGSNCDHDCYHVLKHVYRQSVDFVWHKESALKGYDAVIIPGGFSYGDYLRTGAIARYSPVIKAVERFAGEGGYVLGICNGFQILLESGLLPGAMLRNRSLRFSCKEVFVRLEKSGDPFTRSIESARVLRMPIAHAEGNYYADDEILSELEKNEQIIFRYCTPDGQLSDEANPNGSVRAIAGICNKDRNILGMMPHPERCVERELGGTDGRMIFESVLQTLSNTTA